MALRGFNIYSKRSEDGTYNVLVENSHLNKFLYLKNGVCADIESGEGSTLKSTYNKISSGYGLAGVLKADQADSYLLVITGAFSEGNILNSDVYKVTQVEFIPLSFEPPLRLDVKLVDIQRLLSSGNFYFASSSDNTNALDLTKSRQNSGNNSQNNIFIWNLRLKCLFHKFGIDTRVWVQTLICGSVIIRTIYVSHITAKVAIVSRLSHERVGTRFNIRGVDDRGYVANFVETEQIVTYADKEVSFLQIRGSVPLFWEQPGINVGSHKVKLRCLESSLIALNRHYDILIGRYQSVTTVNLLGHKEGEKLLSETFQHTYKKSNYAAFPLTSFDYHTSMKSSKQAAKDFVKHLLSSFGFCVFYAEDGVAKSRQDKVIRTNCLDCLDRTNSVQTLIGIEMTTALLRTLGILDLKPGILQRFEDVFKEIWLKNGDHCSCIYTGTGALDGKSKLQDASRSIARTIQGNVMDTAKQESFDFFLMGHTFGNKSYDKLSNLVEYSFVNQDSLLNEDSTFVQELVDRRNEYTTHSPVSIFVGTWNVNGGKNMYNVAFKHEQSLVSWIFPEVIHRPYDIVAIGLEEIVDLNASNIVKAGTTNQRVWLEGILKVLKEVTQHDYCVLACEQLVGVCSMILARQEMTPRIKQLDIDEVKTGAGGTIGNKGSVSTRMVVDSTSICFITSHFAAGQNEVKERNEDYNTATRKLKFEKGRQLQMHDSVFWFGDFNYRINLPGEEVKTLVRNCDFEVLRQNDQLIQQLCSGAVFNEFKEGALNFAPTYKYDTFSDDYDTSEKCRAPAWTDRVLWSCEKDVNVQQIHYGRSELKTSDHRPVAAIFELYSKTPNVTKFRSTLEDILDSLGSPDHTVVCTVSREDVDTTAILRKLESELMLIPVSTKKCSNGLVLYFQNNIDAITALSMDGIELAPGEKVSVRLRNQNWVQRYADQLVKNILKDRSCPVDLNLCAPKLMEKLELASSPVINPRLPAVPPRPVIPARTQ
ncbi:unnamed protein product [Bursaphelenchus okinawaensis]|uniref:phosphoinositide 5-phosphatase n=1 Tax=Bursaphelenchus okinawaensis TaxID=465554 RepID=A0A811JTQ5_9BILA|nr:unnamed protein product [Bursaphelenchus okinawaensis]CAG9082859.1 unnamed protein product [Bursaphelenchus okinawaensis]